MSEQTRSCSISSLYSHLLLNFIKRNASNTRFFIGQVIFDSLKISGVVHVAASEENPIEIDCGYQNPPGYSAAHSAQDIKGYSVAFDPLDGSSIVDANFAVGTIAGIWPGKGLLNRRGKEQVRMEVTFVSIFISTAHQNSSIENAYNLHSFCHIYSALLFYVFRSFLYYSILSFSLL